MPSLVWLQRDRRNHDHEALACAAVREQADSVQQRHGSRKRGLPATAARQRSGKTAVAVTAQRELA